jgi:hypothetical protein
MATRRNIPEHPQADRRRRERCAPAEASAAASVSLAAAREAEEAIELALARLLLAGRRWQPSGEHG